LTSCGSQSKKVSTIPNEKSDECLYQEEVCKEAFDFQAQFGKDSADMTKEEKKSMQVALSSYIEHCETAKEQCKKSLK
jgi:hypothetical protein